MYFNIMKGVFTMTNKAIIFMESVALMKEGKLKGTGETVEVENANREKEVYEIPEQIHTFSGWKQLGYRVKKGEKATAAFSIWKYINRKTQDIDNEEKTKPTMRLVKSYFFTKEQVEKDEQKKITTN